MPRWRARTSDALRRIRSTSGGWPAFRRSRTSQCCARSRRKRARRSTSSSRRRASREGSRRATRPSPSRCSTPCPRRWNARPASSARSSWFARNRAPRCNLSCRPGKRSSRRRPCEASAGRSTSIRRRRDGRSPPGPYNVGFGFPLPLVSSPDSKARLAGLVQDAVRKAFPGTDAVVELDRPKNADHGDLRSHGALQLAKRVGKKPRDAAEAILAALGPNADIARTEIAGPGFINFTLASASRFVVVDEILRAGAAFGRGAAGADRRIMVEFVSANPTGPLHVGHGRQAALGDAVSSLLEWQGWQGTREVYYNDSGNQIANLALSVQARVRQAHGEAGGRPEDGYLGDYIRDIAREYVAAHFGDAAGANLEQIRQFAVAYLRNEQDIDLVAFGVKVDSYFLESSLYTDGKVEEPLRMLEGAANTSEKEGALWLRTT